jgi:hypothetical protein
MSQVKPIFVNHFSTAPNFSVAEFIKTLQEWKGMFNQTVGLSTE